MTRECLDAEPIHQARVSFFASGLSTSEKKEGKKTYPLETSQTLIVRSLLALTMKSSFGKNFAEDIE